MIFKKENEIIAAVDLGTNSFHMIVARRQQRHFQTIDDLKEMVQLGVGITDNHDIDAATSARALACLERFSQRLRDVPARNVRAVGTNALRRAYNAQEFLAAAEKTLGHRINIISGIEEARLIYQGVSHYFANPEPQLLVVDIGGGSTELIIGKGYKPNQAASLHMGCVGMSLLYFQDQKISAECFKQAVVHARQELEPIANNYRQLGWDTALGSSGTIASIAENAIALGWQTNGITLKGLYQLKTHLLELTDSNQLPVMTKQRAPVFAGGLAVLIAIFEALKIEEMAISPYALREGLLYDLIGQTRGNTRSKTIQMLNKRYRIDNKHADRIAATAKKILTQLPDYQTLANAFELLDWAAKLHEIGLSISHSGYHRHGGYLVENADLPGFSKQEQTAVATLIRLHRRKLRPEYYLELNPTLQQALLRLAIPLRLAVLLHRNRSAESLPDFSVTVTDNTLFLHFKPDWLEANPLTIADLEQEAHYLRAINISLRVLDG